MQQMALHLDRHIEFLLDQLNRVLGEDNYNLVLVAAHGAPPAPSIDLRSRMAVNGEALAETLQRALGTTPKIEKYLYPFLYLDGAGTRDLEPAREAAARVAAAQPAVASAYTPSGTCGVPGEWVSRFRNSFHPQRSGDVMLSYRPEYIEDFGAGRGVSYGSLYNYDVYVPLCFYGPQFRTETFEQAVEAVDVAPTLARALGVALPSSATGAVLGEALAENRKSKQ
jgi:arylsulfatase A-like enzyme